jgi:hypothetical protein
MANGEMNANSFADMQVAPWKHHIFSHLLSNGKAKSNSSQNLGYRAYNTLKWPHKILMKILDRFIFPAFAKIE